MVELLKSGDLERFVIVVLVFGPLAILWATHQPVDDRLIDIALVILGFYFGVMVTKAQITSDKITTPQRNPAEIKDDP